MERLLPHLLLRTDLHRDERGDVPGWVLVTVMTAGLVMVIWGVAEDQLRSLLTSALNNVR
jgi:hypothetical protein